MTRLISIVMPTYNGAKFMGLQLDSILAQSFEDFELLMVDDGSSDDTVALSYAYAAKDPRIRILTSTGNRGQNARLIELVTASAGKLVAISDQDDIWQANKLALLVNSLGDADLAFGSSWLIDSEGTALNRTLLDEILPPPSHGDRLAYLFKPTVSAHAMIVKRDRLSLTAFKRLHWFDQLIGLDSVFSGGVRWVPDAITYHRLHENNQCNGDILSSPSYWQAWSLPQLKKLARSHLNQRWLFLQRLEHLAFSEILTPSANTTFSKLAKLCTAAWFDQAASRQLYNDALNTELKNALSPLRGSDDDWLFAQYHIDHLTRALHHPRIIYRLGRSVLRG